MISDEMKRQFETWFDTVYGVSAGLLLNEAQTNLARESFNAGFVRGADYINKQHGYKSDFKKRDQ
jgi:hypothetical protein